MTSRLNPYINFEHSAAEALAFYQDVFGGEATSNTFGEFGMEGPDADKIMHGQLETPAGFTLMLADTPTGMPVRQPDGNVTICLSGDDAEELRGYWRKLAEGGAIGTSLAKQMWGDEYGDLTDRFGVSWLVNIAGSPEPDVTTD
jgi:PhnB protein